MADFKTSGNIKLNMELICEVHDRCELLPLYCRDCDCPLCGDCVTRDHVGHKVRKVSEVTETHLKQLRESLSANNSVSFLMKLLTYMQNRQKHSAEHNENLLRNVMDTEKEIVEKVNFWRENVSKKILDSANTEMKYLEKNVALISALLQWKEGGLEIEHEAVKITLLNCGLKRLFKIKNRSRFGVQYSEKLEFRKGIATDDVFDSFGKLIDETEELSSDIYQEEEEEKGEEDDDDDDEFYDCLDLKISSKFKFFSDSIDIILPLCNSNSLLLCNGALYECNFKRGKYSKHRSKLSDVHQIALIQSCGEVLLLMKDQQEIKRISNESSVTTYIRTNNTGELYIAVGAAGEQAYACIAHKTGYLLSKISLLDEFGRILMSFTYDMPSLYGFTCRIFIDSKKRNKLFNVHKGKVEIIKFAQYYCGKKRTNIKPTTRINTTKSYSGSVGTNCVSAFNPTDIAVDRHGNILAAVPNDNAIHLLDKTLTFQKLLVTEEDGLQRPTSVALDAEGYLYVGCEDGQIHVLNYKYFQNTDRLTRLKIARMDQPQLTAKCSLKGFAQKIIEEIMKRFQ